VPPQRLTHPRGKTVDPSNVCTHRPEIAASSQRCRQDDQIVLIAQFCLQPLEVGDLERRADPSEQPEQEE